MKKPKFGIVAVCDAAYRDVMSGKAVIAGLFTGDILSSNYPAMFPVTFFVELLNPEEVDDRLEFEVWVGDVVSARAETEVPRDNPGPAILLFASLPLQLPGPTTVKLKVRSSSGLTTILTKRTGFNTAGLS